MRKNLRVIITYSVLGLICISALAFYLVSGNAPSKSASSASGNGTQSPKVASPANLSAPTVATVSATAQTASSPSGTATPAPTASPMTPEEHVQAVMKKSAEMPAEHLVAIAQGTDYNAVTREVIKRAGGLEKIIKPGFTVVIKPNLIAGRPAGSPICSDWRSIQAIADIAKECGAAKIIVAEASPSSNVFSMAQFDKIQGVELVDMNQCKKEDCYLLKPEKSLTGHSIYIPKIYMDADVVIGSAKLKTHSNPDAIVSLSLKLSMGVPPTPLGKRNLHNLGLKESIVDLNRIRRPDFVVIEGIVGGEGLGPLKNTPVQSNIMFAGSDLVALDTVALTFMGFTVDKVPHVKLASEEGLGISDLSQITVVGADLDDIKMKFKRYS